MYGRREDGARQVERGALGGFDDGILFTVQAVTPVASKLPADMLVGANAEHDAVIESVEQGIRAVKNYREDNPEEYTLWRAAVINSDKSL